MTCAREIDLTTIGSSNSLVYLDFLDAISLKRQGLECNKAQPALAGIGTQNIGAQNKRVNGTRASR